MANLITGATLQSRNLTQEVERHHHGSDPHTLVYLPGGKELGVATSRGMLIVDAETGAPTGKIFAKTVGRMHRFSPDGKWMWSGNSATMLQKTNLETGKALP